MLSDIAGTTNSKRWPARPTADATLACLAGKPLASRFSAWRGVSGHRYICTVYPVDRGAPHDGLPPYRGMIVLAVRLGPEGARDVVAVSDVDADSAFPAPLAFLTPAVDEWHVHLMAETAPERAVALRDLVVF